MAFAMNYWQITASHVQRSAHGQPAARPARPTGGLPVQPQKPEGVETPTGDAPHTPELEAKPRLSFEEMYTMPRHQLPGGKSDSGQPGRYADEVIRMMQASPNLTMEQVKAILKIDRFA